MKTATGCLDAHDSGFLTLVLRTQRLLSECTVLAMVVLIAAEVVCRGLFSFSLMVVEELSAYLLVALVFMSMGIALQDGALFRVEFLAARLALRAQLYLRCLFDLCCLVGMLMLTWQLGVLVQQSWRHGIQAATTLATPLYIPQSIMVLGACTVVLVLLAQMVQTIRTICRGE